MQTLCNPRVFLVGVVALSALAFATPLPAHAASVNHTVLVIMINFTDYPSKPYATSTVAKFFFGTSTVTDPYFPSVASPTMDMFYREASYNQVSFSGKVIGYYTVPGPSTDCNTMMGPGANSAIQQATAAGENPYSYNHVILFYNRGGCGAAGMGTVGVPGSLSVGNTIWIFGYNTPRLFAHEMGHNLGHRHSDLFSCNPAPIAPYANCTQTAYGDISDVMGNWDYSHYNAPHRIAALWIPPTDVQTITANTTTTISSLESTSGLRVLKIPKPDTSDSYFLSFREPIGFNALMPAQFTGGTSVHLWDNSSWSQTRLVNFSGTVLKDGASFFDPNNAITFKQISHTTNTATIAVSMLPCTRKANTMVAVPTSRTAAPGATQTYSIVVTNNDTSECPNGVFPINAYGNSTWTTVIAPTSLTIAPGKSATSTLTVTSATNAGNGTYSTTVSTGRTFSGVSNPYVFPTYVVNSGSCIRSKSTITRSPTSTTTNAGGSARYTLTRVNNDSSTCAPSAFAVSASLPAGWTLTTAPQTVQLNAAAASNTPIVITSPATIAPGTYTIPITLSDPLVPLHLATTTLTYVVSSACTTATPTLTLTPSSNTGTAGSVISYAYSVTNRDSVGCSSSTFNLGGTVPGSWSKVVMPPAVTVAPGSVIGGTFSATSDVAATAGNYTLTLNLSDSSLPSHNTSAAATYTVNTTVPPPPPPSGGTGGSGTMSLKATPVRQGGTSLLTWWATGINAGVTCNLTPSNMMEAGTVTTFVGSTGSTWGTPGNPMAARTVVLSAPVTFTLSCSDGTTAPTSQTVLIKFLPSVKEF